MKARVALNAAIAALAALSVWSWTLALSAEPRLTVTFLDVGQGDCTVIRTPAGSTLVIDAGRSYADGDAGRRFVLPHLRRQGVSRLDALLLTHPDDDHIGGAATLLERLTVHTLFVSSAARPTPLYQSILRKAEARGVRIEPIAAGQSIRFRDGPALEILWPPAGFSAESDNDAGIVARLDYGETRFLLPGDAGERVESLLLRMGADLSAHLLKAGHHGSGTSSSARFLEAVAPAAAIISVGERNVFGHPSPALLQRLEARSIRVFRTDRDGGVIAATDGTRIVVSVTRPSEP